MPIVTLAEMPAGQEADVFALLSSKEELKAKNGKPYFRVTFRDGSREVTFPIWADSPWAADCRDQWAPGTFFKLRAVYRETNFGPQLDIRKIRPVIDGDAADGFQPDLCQPRSRFDTAAMFEELLTITRTKIDDAALSKLVETILLDNQAQFIAWPAARRNHHAFVGGLLEHTLSVTRTCVMLADKYADYYPDLRPPLNKGLVIAGGALHDIGKLREMHDAPDAIHTAEGALIGHMLQGRDIVREAAVKCPVSADTQLRLEHVIVAHQRLPEWGSPKPPMTPEALIVHYADDLDAKFTMMAQILAEDTTPGPLTSKKNVLMQPIYRGE